MNSLTNEPGWLDALVGLAGLIVSLYVHARSIRRRLSSMERELRSQHKDIRRLQVFARRMSKIVFRVEGQRREGRSGE